MKDIGSLINRKEKAKKKAEREAKKAEKEKAKAEKAKAKAEKEQAKAHGTTEDAEDEWLSEEEYTELEHELAKEFGTIA